LGTSGGGKTSLLNIFGTIDKPTKGEITICGQKITNRTTDAEFAKLRLNKIGFVFQTFNLIPSMSALENVSLPMVLAGNLSRSEIKARALALLERVGLGNRVTHLPSQLSGGEQQRVTIARSIANRPELLLLDEPTGDLDTVNSIIILNLLLQLNRHENITCIMVTHDQSLKWYAHRVIHMVDGKVLRIETIPENSRLNADQELQTRVNSIEAGRVTHGSNSTELFDQEQRRHPGNSMSSDPGTIHPVQFTDFREPLAAYTYLNQP
jgi:putative ABC transport system ATP-binding protein